MHICIYEKKIIFASCKYEVAFTKIYYQLFYSLFFEKLSKHLTNEIVNKIYKIFCNLCYNILQ